MKTEWEIQQLSDIVEFNPKETLKKGVIAKKISMDKLQPFYRDIYEYELTKFTGGTKFRNGDTIMARITPCLENGKTAKINILDNGEIGFGSTEYIVFRAKEGISDPDFIYYLVTSSLIREPAIKSMVGSSGRQRVQSDVVEKIKINLPPLPVQKKIAGILKSLDDKIELNRQISKNLEEQARAIYENTFITNTQSSWKRGYLSDLIDVKYGKDHKKFSDGIYPVYGSGGIMRYIEKPLYSKESVLVPRKGTLNNVIYVNEPFWSVDTMFYTEMKRRHIAKFIFHFLKNKDLASLNAGSAVPSMTTNILNAMELPIPDDSTFLIFDNLVTPLYTKIQANEKQSLHLAQIRDTILPRLMSGEIEVM